MDELPTLYFHKIDRLIGTARSNKVSVTLGFQELPQLEADYGKWECKNHHDSGQRGKRFSSRKETLEWLSNDISARWYRSKGRDDRPGQNEYQSQ